MSHMYRISIPSRAEASRISPWKHFVIAATVSAFCMTQTAWSRERSKPRNFTQFAAGEPSRSTKAKVTVSIALVAVDGTMKFVPDELKFARGDEVQFIIRNETSGPHEFVIGSHVENLGHAQSMKLQAGDPHDEPNGRMLKPGGAAILNWRFTKPGKFEFGCLLAGHAEIEVPGTIVVE